MPPVKHDNRITHVRPDGRWEHRFRQSWLNTYFDCPERARREAYGEVDRVETDAANVGTALHYAAEDAIALLGEGILLDPYEVQDLWQKHWDQRNAELDIEFVKRTPAASQRYGLRAAEAFGAQVLPHLTPFATEIPFGPFVLHEDEQRVITATGTIDYIDAVHGMIDWKTASRPYEPWEKQRWAIQPTTYKVGGATVIPDLKSPWHDGPYNGPMGIWHYAVFPEAAQVKTQWIKCERIHDGWDGWLVNQLLPIAYQLEATERGDLPVWPLRDQHALCSPTWCPSWDTCKGMTLSADDLKSHKPRAPWA